MIYYDPPHYMQLHSATAAAAPMLTMNFNGTANQANATIALDSQASTSFVSTTWLQRTGMTYKSTVAARVQLADGRCAETLGVVKLRMRIGQWKDTVTCHVLDIKGFDILLGDTWLTANRAIMDFGHKAVMLFKGKKRFTLKAIAQKKRLGSESANPMLLSALQVKRFMRKRSNRHFLVQIKDSDAQQYLCSMVQQSTDGLIPQERLDAILKEYEDVFQELPEGLPPERKTAHVIPLVPGAQPVYRGVYRLTVGEKAEAERMIADLLRKGLIEPSSSPWGASVLFVPKPDGNLRMCIDYRALNKLTVKNKYPLPNIQELLDSLGDAKCLSGLDLASGYWQIRISESDTPLTAFNTHMGHYQWRVLSMGLTNAPGTFQACMNDIFRDCKSFVLVYLDDILIYSRTPEEHEQHLKIVLNRLREHKFYAKRAKCNFNQKEIAFLGHIVGAEGIKVDHRKVATVESWPVPQDTHQLRSFLGLANYFRRFIQGYSSLTAPLNDLLRKERSVSKEWGQAQQDAFLGVKHALTHAPVLRIPDLQAALAGKAPLELVTDASKLGMGGVLMQEGRVIAFESKRFDKHEVNYGTPEKELLAVIHALKHFRHYVLGVPTTLITDHAPNVFFEEQKVLSPRQSRWYEFLTQFTHLKWEYRPGRTNVADPLSRKPGEIFASLQLWAITRYKGKKRPAVAEVVVGSPAAQQPGQTNPATPQCKLSGKGMVAKKVRFMEELVQHAPEITEVQPRRTAAQYPPPLESALKTATDEAAMADGKLAPPMEIDPIAEDKRIADLAQRITEGYEADEWFANTENVKQLTHQAGLYYAKAKDGTTVLVIPDAGTLRQECIQDCHDATFAGHMGITKTIKLAERTFWWPSMKADIERFVKTCVHCQRNKSSNRKPAGLLKPLPIPGRRWECVSMDWITGLPVTEDKYDAIAVIVDKLTKMVRLAPCRTTDGALETAEMLLDVLFKSHGMPRTIISDRDPRFTSDLFKEICKHMRVKQAMSTAFRPQTDGQTERVNRVLGDMLRCYVAPKRDDWDKLLCLAEFAINNAYHESLGTTPFFLNYGQHPLTPVSGKFDSNVPAALQFTVGLQAELARAKQLLHDAQQRQKHYADKALREIEPYIPGVSQVWLNSKHLTFKTGDSSKKLLPRWVGPFEVLDRIGELAYRLKLPAKWKIHDVFHASLLKPVKTDGRYKGFHPVFDLDGAGGQEVEVILSHEEKTTGKKRPMLRKRYLVKFQGLGQEHNTWVPEKRLQRDCPAVLQAYWDERVRPRGSTGISTTA